MKKTLILLLSLILLVSICSCTMIQPKEKQIPVYEGMTVSSSATEAKIPHTLTASLRYKDDNRDGDKWCDYYAAKGEDVYVHIHFDNPDKFEILSFTFGGEKYSSYMFEYGSNMETIIIKCNVGRASGIHNYKIEAIKYVDGTEIKDVTIKGNQHIYIHVSEYEYAPNCKHDDPEKIEIVAAVAPTCHTTGLTEGTRCKLCNTMSVPQTVIPVIDCIEGDWIIDKEATLTESGSQHTECTMCGKTMSEQELHATGSYGFSYEINEGTDTCIITGIGDCTDTDLIIPAYIDGYKVVAIGAHAFSERNNIESITIPNTVDSIGTFAFLRCTSLASVILPDTIKTIGKGAFSQCSLLNDVTIPQSVESIGESAFYMCSSIVSISIPEAVTRIENYVFFGCAALENIELSDTITFIGWEAFSGCESLEKIVIPDSVTSIGYRAFAECKSISSIEIPELLISIEVEAFMGCISLESITLPSKLETLGERCFFGTSITSIRFNGNVEQWNNVWKDYGWDSGTNEYVVFCSDGEIAKDGSIEYI